MNEFFKEDLLFVIYKRIIFKNILNSDKILC